jgi:hypothetical protein
MVNVQNNRAIVKYNENWFGTVPMSTYFDNLLMRADIVLRYAS